MDSSSNFMWGTSLKVPLYLNSFTHFGIPHRTIEPMLLKLNTSMFQPTHSMCALRD